MSRVYYKKIVEGESIPAIIRNFNYHLISMPVYEDGSISCWERISFQELKEKLDKKWLVTEIPDGEQLSVFQLGYFEILRGEWNFTPDSFTEYVSGLIKKMNPEMKGLFEEGRTKKEQWERERVSWSATGVEYKLKSNFGHDIMDGASTSLFYQYMDRLWLTKLAVYPDGTIQIEALDGVTCTLDDVRKMFADRILTTTCKASEWVELGALGRVQVKPGGLVKSKDKLKEIEEMYREVTGEETLYRKCQSLYFEYLSDPSDYLREELRKAYEAVPEHERCFLGNMDIKDFDYRRIIYSPDEKREV